jgi:hypothetical protein
MAPSLAVADFWEQPFAFVNGRAFGSKAGAVYWLVGGFVDALREWPHELEGTRTGTALDKLKDTLREVWHEARNERLP